MNMKSLFVAMTAAGVLTGGLFGQSAKNAVQVSNVTLLPYTGTNTAWTSLLTTNIQTSSQKDLIFGVSLQTGLFTKTTAKARVGTESSTAMAKAGVDIRVCVSGLAASSGAADCAGLAGYKMAEPGEVTYDKRFQELTVTLENALAGCRDLNADGIIDIATECLGVEVSLLLETLGAHHFTFALDDVGQGTHNVKVQARIQLDSSATGIASGEAKAMVGKGAVTVEEVRLVKGVDITL